MSVAFKEKLIDAKDKAIDATDKAVHHYKEKNQKLRSQIIKDARNQFKRIVGRFNAYRFIATHRLEPGVVKDYERPLVEKLGAVPQADGSYEIPKGVDLDKFQPWFKEVPVDLRDKRPQMRATSDGRPIESLLRNEDTYKGGDSLALPFVYLSFPVITALAYLAGAIHPSLTLATLALLIPNIWTLAQSEKVWAALTATITSSLLPLTVATASLTTLNVFQGVGLQNILGRMSDTEAMLVGAGTVAIVGTMALGGLIFLLGLVFVILLFSQKPEDGNKSRFGGAWEDFKYLVKWAFFYCVALGVTLMLPGWLQPGVAFMLACLNAMHYSQREYDKRSKEMLNQNVFTLAAFDPNTSTHNAKEAQAKAAANDTTPFLEVGTATGTLAKKQYAYAPDEGLVFGLSILDCATNFHFYGMMGSGKTSCFLRPLAVQLRMFGRGGLYDCGKGALVKDIAKLMDIIIEPGASFALIEGMNAQEVSLALNNVASSEGEKRGGDAIWREGAAMLIDHLTVLHEALHEHEKNMRTYWLNSLKLHQTLKDYTLVKMQLARQNQDDQALMALEDALKAHNEKIAEYKEELGKDEAWLWNVDTLDRVANITKQRVSIGRDQWAPGAKLMEVLAWLGYNASEHRQKTRRETIHRGIGAGHLLDHTIRYFTETWPQMDEGQRSSFGINVDQKIQPLMRGATLTDKNGIPWSRVVEGVDIMQALYGKNVGVSLPALEHGLAGQLVSSLVKQRIYKGIRARMAMGEKAWKAAGHKEMVIMWDEAQSLVTEDELTLLPQARSAGVMFVFASQNIENIEARFGHRAQQYLEAFDSIGTLKSSPRTHEYISKRLGEAKLVQFKERVMGIDYKGALDKMLDSPFNDPEHPNYAGIRKIARLGGEKFRLLAPPPRGMHYTNKDLAVDDRDLLNGITVPVGATLEVRPLFEPYEMQDLLIEQGMAVVSVRRGGARRVDLIKLNHVDENAYRL